MSDLFGMPGVRRHRSLNEWIRDLMATGVDEATARRAAAVQVAHQRNPPRLTVEDRPIHYRRGDEDDLDEHDDG